MSTEAATADANPRPKALRYAGLGFLWLISVLLGLGYVLMGWAKFDAVWVEKFVAYGYPAWFTYVVGVGEIAGGVLMFVPRVAVFGATLLAGIMLGATGTHLWHGESNWSFTLILTAILLGIAAARRKLRNG